MSDTRMDDVTDEVARRVLSRAGRQAARARWGTSHLDRLIDELQDRRDDLGPAQVANLKALVDATGATTEGTNR